MLFCLFQPINDVTKFAVTKIAVVNDAKVYNNEVGVRSSNPRGLFLMALNAPLPSFFFKISDH